MLREILKFFYEQLKKNPSYTIADHEEYIIRAEKEAKDRERLAKEKAIKEEKERRRQEKLAREEEEEEKRKQLKRKKKRRNSFIGSTKRT